MSSIGPELPAHLLAKRKHEEEEETKRNASNESRLPLLSSPQSASKRRRVLGPAPPPAPLDQKPAKLPSDSDKSSSEDEYGPVVASKDVGPTKSITAEQTWNSVRQPNVELERKSGRDEWMLVPPTQDDLSARMDPTKLKARKFNTGKGAKSAGQFDVDNTMWTETPEQKRKRLRDQVLGVQEISSTDVEAIGVARKQKEDEEKARKVWEYDVSRLYLCGMINMLTGLPRSNIVVKLWLNNIGRWQRRRRRTTRRKERLITRRIWAVQHKSGTHKRERC